MTVATAFGLPGQPISGLFGSGALDPNLRDTYTQDWNVSVQKKLPKSIYLDVGYVGSKSTNLTMAFDGNRPIQVVTPGPGVAPLANRRPFPGFSGITTTKSIGNSTFHSLQAKVERRVASGLSVLGSYTFSKALGNADISTVGGGTFLGGTQNYFNLAGERSPTAFDIRHRLSIAGITSLSSSPSKALIKSGRAPPVHPSLYARGSTPTVGDLTCQG